MVIIYTLSDNFVTSCLLWKQGKILLSLGAFVVGLEFNCPGNTIKAMLRWSVYILFLGRLSQQKRENDHRKYFMTDLHKINDADPVGIELTTSWSPVGSASDWATKASFP